MSDCTNAKLAVSNQEKNADAGEKRKEASSEKRKKPPSPQRCREFIRRQAAQAMPTIVDALVKKAKEGSVPHFAALAKVGGFDQRSAALETPKRRGKSFARRLLDDVEEYEANQAALAKANVAAEIEADSYTEAQEHS